ncbi:LINE-1 retrotransposable element ORF2 protein [Cucumis melo var. makuwa]|uniref:LINE-1 retrotransposable element ORF2 protein n=1 Tax=Cucumis melo var. makuwa TaxID=1194695 RepID=A0A5A7U366_CUCMM|nr:LINE-1 retrotransposable element ORF2 protein [Cucumis melo var. makuwa]TYK18174.1 LINE-1 retrotransposable element ORF2 protein [Cucumis melo var. makuwa]
MDYLSRLLNHLEKRQAIKGAKINNSYSITHLLFADDILIFVEDDDVSIKNLQTVLMLFELASRLKINLLKSTISLVNISNDRASKVASILGFTQQFLPINYLGVPLGGKPISKVFWSQIIENIHKKLSSWKYNHITKGERLTLIRSSLESNPTYQLSIFKAPNQIYKDIDKIWRNFLWGSISNSNNPHLINWGICTLPKDKGGLGITRMKASNFALLTKWLCCYHRELEALWKSIIDAKYSKTFTGGIPYFGKYSSSNAPWRSIIKGKDWFNSKIIWKINSGGSHSFWHSNWANSISLNQKAPRLYALSSCKEATVKEVWDPGTNDWDKRLELQTKKASQ